MASTYSTNLAIELIGTGDQAGTWGTTTNSNLGTLIEQSISGYVTQAVSTGTDTTITIPNGSTGVARNMYIELTGTGGASTNLIVPANKKLYFIFNNSTGAVTVKVSGQTGVSVPTGKKMVLVSNGTDIVNGLNYIADFATNSFTVTNLTASSGTITNLLATSGSITNLVSSDASATVLRAGSATLTHLSATSATITNLTLTSLVISNLSIASANITTLTSASATITNLLATSLAVSSIATFAAGSAAAPSITTTGDTNTGIFFPAADTIAFTEGGVESMRIDSSGNVGIGTTPVVYAGYNTLAQNATTGSTFEQRVGGTLTGSLTTDSQVTLKSLTAIPLVFGTNNTERMRLDTSGNLGIGTTSPGAKAEIYVTRTSSTNAVALILNDNVTGAQTSGVYKAIRSLSNAGASVSEIRFMETDGSNNNTSISFATQSTANALTERLRIDQNGNLGLGVTPSVSISPALQVYSGSSYNGLGTGAQIGANTYFGSGSSWRYIGSGKAARIDLNAADTGEIRFFNTSTSGTAGNAITFTQAMTLDASGNLILNGTTQIASSILNVRGDGAYIGVGGSTVQMLIGDNGSTNGFLGTFTNHDLTIRTNNTERARITAAGLLLVGTTTGTTHVIKRDTSSTVLTVLGNSGVDSIYINSVDATGANLGTGAALYAQKNSISGRSINAAGTINASGADYAEYMLKASNFVIAKGDVCGIDANGKLTNVFSNSVSFVVKSTNPSYVGGDTWADEELIGKKPTNENELAKWYNRAEESRQKVDRIAFAGQVPVNVLGATPGQYIVPINDNGAIKGVAVSSLTFEQYQSAVGKVIAVQDDGRALIIVKVA